MSKQDQVLSLSTFPTGFMPTGLIPIGLKNYRLTTLWIDLVGRTFQPFSLSALVAYCGVSRLALVNSEVCVWGVLLSCTTHFFLAS